MGCRREAIHGPISESRFFIFRRPHETPLIGNRIKPAPSGTPFQFRLRGHGDSPWRRPRPHLRPRGSWHIIALRAGTDSPHFRRRRQGRRPHPKAPAHQKGKSLADLGAAGWEKRRNRSAKFLCAPVAQLWIEQWIPNPCVARSSRAGGTIISFKLKGVNRNRLSPFRL